MAHVHEVARKTIWCGTQHILENYHKIIVESYYVSLGRAKITMVLGLFFSNLKSPISLISVMM